MSFRCAAASLERDESALGTASTVRAFLLVEKAGPWGVEALRDSRLPHEVKDVLRSRSAAARVRTLLIRRHRGAPTGPDIRVFAAYADPVSPWMETSTVEAPEALVDIDLEALGRGDSPGLTPTDDPVFCVCTHGRHDACCAELGRPAASALAVSHPEHTWDVSHIGGDRFAANVLVLPHGLYYGRVSAARAPSLAQRHLDGHLDLDLLRGRSGHGFAAQVAEVAVRREVGETRTDAVRLMSAQRSGDVINLVLDVAGTAYEVSVRRTEGAEPHRLTCSATHPDPAPSYDVLAVSPASRGAAGPASPPSPHA